MAFRQICNKPLPKLKWICSSTHNTVKCWRLNYIVECTWVIHYAGISKWYNHIIDHTCILWNFLCNVWDLVFLIWYVINKSTKNFCSTFVIKQQFQNVFSGSTLRNRSCYYITLIDDAFFFSDFDILSSFLLILFHSTILLQMCFIRKQ